MNLFICITGINPEPWQSPDLGVKRVGKKWVPTSSTPAKQRAYQQALRESIAMAYPTPPQFPKATPLQVNYIFRRRLDKYVTDTGRNMTAHRADLTNILKATEDTLQKPTSRQLNDNPDWVYFFDNDVDVRSSAIVMDQQGIHVTPLILINITEDDTPQLSLSGQELVEFLQGIEFPDPPGNVGIWEDEKGFIV